MSSRDNTLTLSDEALRAAYLLAMTCENIVVGRFNEDPEERRADRARHRALYRTIPEAPIDNQRLWETSPHTQGRHVWRCFSAAFDYLVVHDNIPGIKLAHGTYVLPLNPSVGAPGRAPHAWVEFPDGVVFDGVAQRFYNRDDYYRALGIERTTTYTPDQARAALKRHCTLTKWHERSEA